jgi:hypothetical protein
VLLKSTAARQAFQRTFYHSTDFHCNGIAASSAKSAVYSVVSPFNKDFVPKKTGLPKPLTSLYNEQYINLNYVELLNACDKISLSVNAEECQAKEKETKTKLNPTCWQNNCIPIKSSLPYLSNKALKEFYKNSLLSRSPQIHLNCYRVCYLSNSVANNCRGKPIIILP